MKRSVRERVVGFGFALDVEAEGSLFVKGEKEGEAKAAGLLLLYPPAPNGEEEPEVDAYADIILQSVCLSARLSSS